jgi:hypothetical protein
MTTRRVTTQWHVTRSTRGNLNQSENYTYGGTGSYAPGRKVAPASGTCEVKLRAGNPGGRGSTGLPVDAGIAMIPGSKGGVGWLPESVVVLADSSSRSCPKSILRGCRGAPRYSVTKKVRFTLPHIFSAPLSRLPHTWLMILLITCVFTSISSD